MGATTSQRSAEYPLPTESRPHRGRFLNGSNFLEGWQSRHTAFEITNRLRLWPQVGGLLKVCYSIPC